MVKADPNRSINILLLVVILFLAGCGGPSNTRVIPAATQEPQAEGTRTNIPPTEMIESKTTQETMDEDRTTTEEQMNEEKAVMADVISVDVSGSAYQYQFSVGISSPDTGCEQYADWWEVLSENGELIYRRILDHSHVNEQPFIRSGGSVDINPDQVVIIRAHMNQAGYGGVVRKGSIDSGFVITKLPSDFAPEVEIELPLPTGCNF